jgi:phosphatidylserine/phosphatidylglycerophosphate/cardiolipin synthase-like enzyme
VSVCFAPGGNCTDAIVHALGDAKRTVLVQAYSFTSAPIAKALLDAHTRGVQVQVILDESQRTEKYSSADCLANQGVPTMIGAEHAIAHNKVRHISDGEERNSVASIVGRSCTHPTTPTAQGEG